MNDAPGRQPRRERAQLGDVGLDHGLEDQLVVAVGGDLLLLDVAHHPARERPRQRRRALDRRGAAGGRLDLGVAQRGRRRGDADGLGRVGDVAAVGRRARPLVAARVRRVPGRRPQRQDVVGEVVVEVDQPRRDHAAGRHAGGAPLNPAGARRRLGWTASIVPSAPMYTAPPVTTGWASSNVTTVPVRTIGATRHVTPPGPGRAARPRRRRRRRRRTRRRTRRGRPTRRSAPRTARRASSTAAPALTSRNRVS